MQREQQVPRPVGMWAVEHGALGRWPGKEESQIAKAMGGHGVRSGVGNKQRGYNIYFIS